MQPTPTQETFSIEFNGKIYSCRAIEKNGQVLYQINFNTSYLYLTQAKDVNGMPFWTSIPADRKSSHVVRVLGEQIKNHVK